ncbi:hypothetical protein SAMN06265220_104407 [Flavobacterium nitrogenifigens]|uniref:Uncharacterized protein n=1 Tax=Flavobacterium nitrogenifigens TaxID=1617283 RepID=A0A521EL89_9FLAO|nr:hypothetical protein SAMN06265220_104407 [Flavobacterium nitrogenifigens]
MFVYASETSFVDLAFYDSMCLKIKPTSIYKSQKTAPKALLLYN